MSEHYDVAVLGAGPGGYVAALKAAQLGARVAIVEKEYLGGTCLNYGCIPSKALLASAELLHKIRRAGEYGLHISGQVTFDWSVIQARKDKVLVTLRGGTNRLLEGRGVAIHQGRATLDAPGKVAVEGPDGQRTNLTAGKIILATGSVPARIPGWPDDPAKVCTSDEALHWETLPTKLLIVGGGYIGCEFACLLHEYGVEVTVVEMMDALLPGLDADLGAEMHKAFRARGLKVFTGVKVESLDDTAEGLSAKLSNGETLDVDRVLVSVGRRPNTTGIGLEKIGLTTERGFVGVDDRLATGAPDVYCIGDANGRMMLAHAASAQGIVAATNACGGSAVDDKPVTGCVFTFPEIGTVGKTQDQCRAEGLPIRVGRFPIGHLGKALAAGETDGFVKVIRHRETDALLGVHMIGHAATECIAAAAAMIGTNATTHDLADTTIAHPTISESLKEAAEDALGAAIHLRPGKVARIPAGS